MLSIQFFRGRPVAPEPPLFKIKYIRAVAGEFVHAASPDDEVPLAERPHYRPERSRAAATWWVEVKTRYRYRQPSFTRTAEPGRVWTAASREPH